jgi:hypothetical protein
MLQSIKRKLFSNHKEPKPKTGLLDLMIAYPYLTTGVIILIGAGIYYFYYNNYFYIYLKA